MSDPFLTPQDVADIVAILEGSDYRELDIATGRYRLKVRREGEAGAGQWSQEWQWAAEHAPAAAIAPEHTTPAGLIAVTAPLPGAFYRAPAPGAAPFVEPGATVTADTVVAIIETMKLMNPIHAGTAGEVVAILADNAAMVENGAVLMHIRPAS